MNENKWFTCAEFNAKTEANYRKRQARRTAAIRHYNKLIALDLTVIAICLLALGVLIGCAF